MTQILRFQADHPQIRVSLHEYDQKRIWDMLQENQLDLAILRIDTLPTDELDVIPLLSEEIVLVCPLEHRLSRKSEASITELKDEHFVLVDEKSEIHHLCIVVCRNRGFEPNVSCTSTRHETLMDMILEGFGISLIPRNLINPEMYPQLAFIPLTEKIMSTTALVKKVSQSANPDLTMFFNYFLNKAK
jgi:DNA-binding transcriptional LysR family regulator